jgi:hypothetical protein
MSLNKFDIQYRDNSSVRIRTRALVAMLVGIFANWLWLFILIGIISTGELFTMYKIFSHSPEGEKLVLDVESKGRIMGHAFMGAFPAFITTVALACIIRLLKLLIIKIF